MRPGLDPRQGGTVRAAIDICSAATLAGDQCTIASVGQGEALWIRPSLPSEVEVVEFGPTWPRRYKNSAQLAHWLRRHVRDFDLVEIHEVFVATSLLAAYEARRQRVPFIVRPHGALDPFDLLKHQNLKRALSPLFGGVLLKRAAALFFTTDKECDDASLMGSDAPRYVVPLPVVVREIPRDRDAFRRRYRIPDTSHVVLFLSRIDDKKGLPRLFRAFRTALPKLKEARLVLVGTGPQSYVTKMRNEVFALGLQRQVLFVGFLSGASKAEALASADIFCLPSDYENFGIALVEALYAGVPTVVTEGVHIAHELSRRAATIMVPPSPAALADAMLRVLLNPELAALLAANAKAAAKLLFDPVAIGQREALLRREIVTAYGSQNPRN